MKILHQGRTVVSLADPADDDYGEDLVDPLGSYRVRVSSTEDALAAADAKRHMRKVYSSDDLHLDI